MSVRRMCVGGILACAVLSAQAIQVAGDLLVNVDAADLSSLPNYSVLGYWENKGSLGLYFTNAIPGKGPVYQTNVAGAPAVTFQSSSADSIMTNLVAVPPSICGTDNWSFETWVYNPALSGTEVVFSWTARNGWPVAGPGSCVEFRYGADTGNAVEHYSFNLPWYATPNANMVPAVGVWHYVVGTRDEAGFERLYVDGQLRSITAPLIMRVRTDGMFTLGSTRNYAYTNTSTDVSRQMENWSNYGYPFSGSLAKLRIHDGTLTPGQVMANYYEERGTFGVSEPADSVWNGAADQALPWEDAGNWVGAVPSSTNRVVLAGGGTTVVTTAVGELGRFFPYHGTLVMSNDANLVSLPWQMNTVTMAAVSNALFNLELRQGSFSMLDYTNGHTLICGQNGGRFNGVIGGGAGPAVLDGGRDVHIGSGNYTIARMTVEDGGSLYTSNGWIYVGVNGIADAKLTVNGGYVGYRKAGGYDLVVGHNNAYGVLEVNGGVVASAQDLVFTRDAYSRCYGEVDLNGGVIQARRVYGQGTFSNTGTNIFIFNGGVLRNRDSQTSYIQDLHWAWVRPGGAKFDVQQNTAIVVPQALLTDPGLGDGGLTKYGSGTLTLSGANTFTGDVTVAAGHLCFSNSAGLVSGYAGTVRVSAGGSVGYAKAGGLAELVGCLDEASTGSITVYPVNSAENLDFTAFPSLGIGFLSGVTYTGTYTPYAGRYVFSAVGTNNIYAQTIGGTASVTFNGDPAGSLDLAGDNSYSGGTTINGGTLCMRHANALGVAGGSPDIGIYNGAALKLNASGVTAAIVSRIKPDSVGYIILGGACSGLSLDLTGLPGIRVGTDVLTFNYSGTVTPEGDVYRMGGGRVPYASSFLGFVVTNLIDGTVPRKLVLDGLGMVCPSNAAHTGGTVVSNNAALHLRWDRGLGAVPASPDPSNLVVNGGVFRPGSTTFSTHVNRGITVGPDGMVLHPNGSQTFTVLGNLHGSGAITNTDSGTVWLGGTGNTYSGKLAINSGTVGAGNGSTFSWNKDARVGGNGGTFALYYNGDLSWSGAFGAAIGDGSWPFIGFRKTGSGTLTMDVAQSYSGSTTVDNGTLKVGAAGAVPGGHNRGNVYVNSLNYYPRAVLDVNGYNLDINGLYGGGSITDSTAAATQILVGNNNQFSSYNGPVAPNLTLTKIGTSALTLNKGAVVKDVAIVSGTNMVAPDAKVTGTISMARNAVLSIGANTNEICGLLGEYFDFSNTALRQYATTTSLVSLAVLNQTLLPFTPNTIAMSSVSNVFSFGYSGAFFQNKGDYRVVRWTGKFLAETAGDYWFDSNSDDGSMVFVEGVTVVSNNFSQGFEPRNALRKLQKVTLAQGWHDIVIGYYNGTGQYGLTVYMTPPGGVEAPLPQRLLRPPTAKVGALTGANTSVMFFMSGSAAAQVTPPADAVYEGLVTGSNFLMAIEKTGAAKQTLRRLNFEGSAEVREGTLELLGNGMFGAPVQTANAGLAVSNGATFAVRSCDPSWPNAGLAGLYYNYPNFNNNTFSNLVLLANAFTMRVPDLVAGTHLAGVNFDMDPNTFFPAPYNTGYAVDFATMYHGRLVIREQGTYTFMLSSDDRSDMYIDGVAVLTNAFSSSIRTSSTNLAAGSHEVLIPFQQGAGGYRIYANWTPPGSSSVPLPNSVLRPWTVQTGPLSGSDGAAVTLPDPGSFLRVNEFTNTVFDGAVSGVNGSELEKGGLGRLQLGGGNDTFLGSWFLSQGELWAGNGATAGTLGGSNIYVSGGATLVFNRADDIVYRGDIAGKGTIRSAGAGRVTLAGDASGFSGTVAVENGQSVYLGDNVGTNALLSNEGLLGLSGRSTYLDARRITGAGRIGIEDRATLSLAADQQTFANELVVSNGVLALAITNTPSDWTLGKLTLQAGSGLEVVPSGLFGRFYDIPSGDIGTIISNAFLTLESAEAYFAAKTPSLTASTWLQGEGFDFGIDSTGTNGTALFPGKYRKPFGQSNNYFAGFWQGKIRITEPGTYTFSTYSDDGSCIYIDGATVVNNAGSHGLQTRTGAVALTNGLHDIGIVFQQGGGGYGLYASIVFPGDATTYRLPNRMMVARAEDTPDYSVAFGEIDVVNGPGSGAVSFTGPGTLKMTDLWIDTGAKLAVAGGVACSASELTVTVPEEIPYGITVVGDFTETDGLDLSGVTLVSTRPEAELRYKDKLLYFARSTGTVILLK